MKRIVACLFLIQIVAVAQAQEPKAEGSISPDGKWEFRLAEADEEQDSGGGFVIAKRGSKETSVALSEEAEVRFAEYAKVIWAPDSRRFAFNYQAGLRYKDMQFYQLDGEEWRELDAPGTDDAINAPINRSMAAQRKKLKLPPKKTGRPISDGGQVRKWIDPGTVLLYAFTHETFEIKKELEQVGDSCFITLKFDPRGKWKIVRTRLLSDGVARLNKEEREELARMEKESDH